ncbi:MAG: zinc-ribbon domain-containing protein [Candidatus Bathyarchaeia archaeon]
MTLYCPKCGAQLPDDAIFCIKCGTRISALPMPQAPSTPVIASLEAKSLRCPHCGAPITPKFGEMVISCEYCGTAVILGSEGWRGIHKQTMLPLKLAEQDKVVAEIRSLMDRGLLHRHFYEGSRLEEMSLSFVPYWIVSVSTRTSVIASDIAVQAGEIATTAALFGVMGSAMSGRRRGVGIAGPLLAGAMLGTMMGPGQAGAKRAYQMDNNYNIAIVAVKAFNEYQPKSYQFNLHERMLFDVSKIPKSVKILNGDVGEEAAKYQAKTLADQLQSEKAHAQYHMIQQLHTDVDVTETELLYAPIWFAQYDHKGNKIILVIDGNSGGVINSIGL